MLSTCVQHWLFPNRMQHHSILNNDSGTFTDVAIHGYENVLTPPRYLQFLQIDLFAICLFVSLHKLQLVKHMCMELKNLLEILHQTNLQ